MDSGKTPVVRLVAQRLGVRHLDSDEMVSARTGKTVLAIFDAAGEAAIARGESAVLAEAVREVRAVVSVACGAGLDAANRALWRGAGSVVWIRTDLDALVAIFFQAEDGIRHGTVTGVQTCALPIFGPSHNYAGLSLGNVASMTHGGQVSEPRAAALQGIDKMRANLSLGLAQGIFLPHPRPDRR